MMRNIKFITVVISVLVIAAFIFSACSQPAPAPAPTPTAKPTAAPTTTASPQTFEWKYLTTSVKGNPYHVYIEDFAKRIKDLTGGRLNITVYPIGGLVFKSSEHLRAVGDGHLDMAGTIPGFVGGDLPLISLADQPYLAFDYEQAEATKKLAATYINKEMSPKFGAEILWVFYGDFQALWSKKPLRSLDDLKGLKVRVVGSEELTLLKQLGASPLSVDTTEVATALQQGLVEAVSTSSSTAIAQKWYEMVKYAYRIDLISTSMYQVVNLKSLNSLPADIRKIVRDEADKTTAGWKNIIKGLETESFQKAASGGVEIVPMTLADKQKMRETAKPNWEAWGKKTSPTAEEGIKALIAAAK